VKASILLEQVVHQQRDVVDRRGRRTDRKRSTSDRHGRPDSGSARVFPFVRSADARERRRHPAADGPPAREVRRLHGKRISGFTSERLQRCSTTSTRHIRRAREHDRERVILSETMRRSMRRCFRFDAGRDPPEPTGPTRRGLAPFSGSSVDYLASRSSRQVSVSSRCFCGSRRGAADERRELHARRRAGRAHTSAARVPREDEAPRRWSG